MKPVEQTIVTTPKGDCFRACLASILELPIEACPNPPSDPDGHWWNEWIEWLEARGYELIQWTVPENGGEQRVCSAPRGYWIATVPSLNAPPPPPGRPNLGRHCVVMRGDYLVHDPSTAEKWTAEKWAEGGRIFEVTLVHPLDPVRLPATPEHKGEKR